MRRALLALVFALLAPQALAQTPLRIQVVYNSDANAYWTARHVAPFGVATAIVSDINNAFAQTQLSVNATMAGVEYYECCKGFIAAMSVYENLYSSRFDVDLADIMQSNNADLTIAITQHPIPNGSAGYSWSDSDRDRLFNSVIVLDASTIGDGSYLYWIGRMLGAKNQRTGGNFNETDGTAHGVWLQFGSSRSDCEVAVTLDTNGVNPPFHGECLGGTVGWVTPSYHECNMSAFCTGYVLNVVKPSCYFCENMQASYNAVDQSCHWTGTVFNNPISGQAIATPHIGTYDFTCGNITHLNTFSNPNATYKGIALGDSNNNSAATMAQNLGWRSIVHGMDRPGKIRRYLGSVFGVPPAPR